MQRHTRSKSVDHQVPISLESCIDAKKKCAKCGHEIKADDSSMKDTK